MDTEREMNGNSHPTEKTTMPDMPIESDAEDTELPATRQQKLIKAGLLFSLVAIIIYVVLDYTVSWRTAVCIRVPAAQAEALRQNPLLLQVLS